MNINGTCITFRMGFLGKLLRELRGSLFCRFYVFISVFEFKERWWKKPTHSSIKHDAQTQSRGKEHATASSTRFVKKTLTPILFHTWRNCSFSLTDLSGFCILAHSHAKCENIWKYEIIFI